SGSASLVKRPCPRHGSGACNRGFCRAVLRSRPAQPRSYSHRGSQDGGQVVLRPGGHEVRPLLSNPTQGVSDHGKTPAAGYRLERGARERGVGGQGETFILPDSGTAPLHTAGGPNSPRPRPPPPTTHPSGPRSHCRPRPGLPTPGGTSPPTAGAGQPAVFHTGGALPASGGRGHNAGVEDHDP